jgi:hypothetical protein
LIGALHIHSKSERDQKNEEREREREREERKSSEERRVMLRRGRRNVIGSNRTMLLGDISIVAKERRERKSAASNILTCKLMILSYQDFLFLRALCILLVMCYCLPSTSLLPSLTSQI